MIRAILFDFFDVFRTDGFKRWLKTHGYEHTGAILRATEKHDHGDYDDKAFFQELASISGQPAARVEAELEANNELNKELVTYVGSLQGRYKLALVSNSASDYLRAELAKYDLEKYFDEIVISSEVGFIKPQPEIFDYITKKLGVLPEECIFTDDNPKYVAAADRLGIHGIVYTSVPELQARIGQISNE